MTLLYQSLRCSTILVSLAVCLAGPAAAQPQPATNPPGGRGGGFTQPVPSDWNQHEGWVQIFDGKTLNSWNCDPNVWSVEDGAITAKSTPENPTGTTYC